MSERLARRVLLVGWDAADWQLAQPLIDAGQMPTLAGLIARGVHGNLATLEPILSPMLWNSIATGKTADQHGICGFTEPLPDGSGIRPVSSRSRKCKALWNILTQNDLRSHVVGWYASHPAEPIRGTMVSNQFEHPVGPVDQPWAVPDGAVHPPEAIDRLADLRVHPSEIDASAVLPFVPDAAHANQEQRQRLGKLRTMLAQTASIHTVATELLAKDDWDFAAVYYEGIDRFGHEFMEFHPPRMEQVDEADYEMFRHAMTGIYRFHDMMLETLLTIAGPETVVILISDHGYYNNHLRPDPATAGPVSWHRPIGMMCMAGPGIKTNERVYGASILDATPTVLRLLGLPVAMDMAGRAWLEAFEQPLGPERIFSWESIDGNDGRHPPDLAEDPAAAREALQQLVDLGYIEAPAESVQKTVEDTKACNDCSLATSLMSSNRPGEALALLEALPEATRNSPQIMLQRALCLMSLDRLDEARSLTEKAAPSASGHPRALLILGMLASAEGDAEAAYGYFEDAATRNPSSVDTQSRLARACLAAQMPERAEAAFRRAVEIDPDHAMAHDGLSQCAIALERPEEAIDHALQAVELRFHFPRAHLHLGQALARCGHYEQAAEAVQVSIGQTTGFWRAHAELAEIYDALGDTTRADEQRLLASQRKQPAGSFAQASSTT